MSAKNSKFNLKIDFEILTRDTIFKICNVPISENRFIPLTFRKNSNNRFSAQCFLVKKNLKFQ